MAKDEQSPSGEKEGEDDDASMLNFVKTQVNKLFIDHIPVDSIKELPDHYIYVFGFAAHVVAITIFIYFLYASYTDAINQAFISLTNDSGDCSTVPIAIYNTYLADTDGNWVGTPEYLESDAVYKIGFNNFQVGSTTEYIAMMERFYQELILYGDIAIRNNLGVNMVIWSTYLQYYSLTSPNSVNFTSIGYGQLQSITLTAVPSVIFELDHLLANVGSVQGFCAVENDAVYDQANSLLSMTYTNVSLFSATPSCNNALYPYSFGYLPNIDHNEFSVKLDVRSLMVALSVNYALLPLGTIQPVSRELRNFTYSGVLYSFGDYYDSVYSLMDTIVCIQNLTEVPSNVALPTTLCVHIVGSTFALPLLNHYGLSSSAPVYCSCEDGVGESAVCNQFNFLEGLLFYDNPNSVTNPLFTIRNANSNLTAVLAEFGLFNLMNLVGLFPNYLALNRAAYNASYFTANPAVGDNCNAACLTMLFDFCNLGGAMSCSLLMFNSQNYAAQTVSPFKFQLTNGSCSNSFVIAPAAWQKLIDNPPVQFTQTYYECYETTSSALLTSLGVASGNSQLFIPIVMVAILPLIYAILVCIRQVPPKEEYQKIEKAQVMDILSLVLLRMRDGKTRNIKKDGVLLRMAKELIASAKEEGGYPDSDDEDEDEGAEANPHNSRTRSRTRTSLNPMHEDTQQTTDDKRKGRHRMQVFTKHLPENKSKGAGMRASSVEEGVEMGLFSYLRTGVAGAMGGSQQAQEVTGIDKYLDLSRFAVPSGIYLLNLSTSTKAHPLKPHESDALLDDLLKYFGECLAFAPPADGHDSDDEEGAPKKRRDLESFQQASKLSARLSNVDLAYYLNSEDGTIFFIKLANIVCMHASIQLDMEMREVAAQQADRIAYNVGQRLMTAAQLQSVLA